VSPQCGQGIVAGVVVAVEADGILRCPRRHLFGGHRQGWLRAASGNQEKSGKKVRQESHRKVFEIRRGI
jgi:hypothetical protein